LHIENFEAQINIKKPRKNPGFELFLILRRSKDQRGHKHKKAEKKISAYNYDSKYATSPSGDIAEKKDLTPNPSPE